VAALRYRQLAPAEAIDTTPLETGGSEAATALSHAFKSFSNAAAEVGSQWQADRGQQEGAAQGATGTLKPVTGFFSQTAHAKAYNNAALRSYAIKAEADAEDTGARLEVQAGTNPHTFAQTFGAVRDSTINNAPPEARAALNDIYNRRMGDGLARIGSAQAREVLTQARADTVEGISRSTDRIANWNATNDPAQHALADQEQEKLNLIIEGARRDGTISDVEAKAAYVHAQHSIVAQTVEAKFQLVLDNPYGDPVKFIQQLRTANKTSETLSPEEEAKLSDQLLAALRQHNTLASEASAAARAAMEAKLRAGDIASTDDMINGHLTIKTLSERMRNHDLSPEVARTLYDHMTSTAHEAKDDPAAKLHARVNLLEYTDDDILKMRGLTDATKGDLILERRKQAEGWQSTPKAREAIDMIDRRLGIVPGSNSAMLTISERTARDRARLALYDTVDPLPPAARDAAVIPAANEAIKKFIGENAADKADKQRRYKANFIQENESKVKGMSKAERAAYDAQIKQYDDAATKLDQQAGR
jgi:hypothetical protein